MRTSRPKDPTLRDVAKMAGVSHTAVSLALDEAKSSRLSPETRQRILAIAEKLKYRPDPVARSLATKETRTLGLVVTTLVNPFYAEIAQDIIERAKEIGYGVSTCSACGGVEEERRSVEGFLNRGVDGLILCSALRRDPVVDELIEIGRPFVLAMRNVDRGPGDPPVSYVGLDNCRGAFLAADHLLGLGHERIGFIAGPETTSTGYDRKIGALAAMKQRGLSPDPSLIHTGDFTRSSGYELGRKLLNSSRPPTAIFAMNDWMAIGALEAMVEAGVKVPQEMAIVGFDDIDVAGLKTIDLTTVSQKKATMGRLAVDHLIEIINGESDQLIRSVILEPVLVIRRTCGASLGGRRPAGTGVPPVTQEHDVEK
jgi:LacI family transcriptional regulator